MARTQQQMDEEMAKVFALLERIATALERMAAAAEQDLIVGKDTLAAVQYPRSVVQ